MTREEFEAASSIVRRINAAAKDKAAIQGAQDLSLRLVGEDGKAEQFWAYQEMREKIVATCLAHLGEKIAELEAELAAIGAPKADAEEEGDPSPEPEQEQNEEPEQTT